LAKRYILAVAIAMIAMAGLTGCGLGDTSGGTPEQQPPDAVQTTGESGNPGRQINNPAVKAAMDINRLQNNQNTVFTQEQKNSLKPILLELIDTTNTTPEFLQEKADAITTVFTDTQKSYLAGEQKNEPAGGTAGGEQPTRRFAGDSTQGDGGAPRVEPGGREPSGGQEDNGVVISPESPSGQGMDPSEVYQRALEAISK